MYLFNHISMLYKNVKIMYTVNVVVFNLKYSVLPFMSFC